VKRQLEQWVDWHAVLGRSASVVSVVLTAVLLVLAIATVASVDEPLDIYGSVDERPPPGQYLRRAIVWVTAMLLLAPAAATLCWRASTYFLQEVALFVFLAWADSSSTCLFALLSIWGKKGLLPMLVMLSQLACLMAMFALLYWLHTDLMVGLERNMLRPLGSRLLKRCLAVLVLVFGLMLAQMMLVLTARPAADALAYKLFGATCWVLLALMLAQPLIPARPLRRVLALTGEAARRAEGEAARLRTEQGRRILELQRLRLSGSLLGLVVFIAFYLLLKGWLWPAPIHVRERLLDAAGGGVLPAFLLEPNLYMALMVCLHAYLAVLGSGALTGALAHGLAAATQERRRVGLRARATKSYTHCSNEDWHEKVKELAHRAVTLEALVSFYLTLGRTCMTHFDPSRHTTNDVVRQAIIPLSSARESSMAEVLMNGAPTRPQSMVTHNWGNLFRDLVAAIVADALRESNFENVAELLEVDPEKLLQWLDASGVLGRAYWVCAFSVNQHAGICDTNYGHGKDAVTGLEFPLCNCGAAKFGSTSQPLRDDGASINCEMNKFDDMMAWLAATDRGFGQVIAVDRDFRLFSRAWCVAELAVASEMGMSQRMKVLSPSALNENAGSLEGLRVQDMQASRPEDVDIILSKIHDVGAFNQKLHDLIFGTLLSGWWLLDARQQLELVAQVARWQETAAVMRRSLGSRSDGSGRSGEGRACPPKVGHGHGHGQDGGPAMEPPSLAEGGDARRRHVASAPGKASL